MHRFFTQQQLPWILLWIGLAFLIILLGMMIRTNWGQSHPLRKCAGLSLLAHLLLLCYATTIQIVSATGTISHGSVNVTLVDGYADGLDDPSAVVGEDSSTDPVMTDTTSPSEGKVPQLLADTADPTSAPSTPLPPVVTPPREVQHSPTAPPLLEVAKTEPHETADPAAKEPPAAETVEGKPEKAEEPVTPANNVATQPKLPEPAQTTEESEWLAGEPTGSSPKEAAKEQVTRTENGTDPSASAPLVEVAAAPIASRSVPEMYADRFSPQRSELLRRRGGTAESESAVQAALQWLAASQSSDGRWDAAQFGAGHEQAVLGQDRQGAGAKADTAMTGLALLAFLGAGNTHRDGAYAKNVQHGLEFLLNVQGQDGNLAGQAETYAYMYSHGMATFALCEAYAMTGDKRLEPAVRAAIRYTLSAQIRSSGGWRYRQVETPGEQGDTSQLGWQWMALKSAEQAGIEIPQSSRDGIVRYLKSVQSSSNGGRASYRPGERASRTMTAEALVCRQFLGMARENPAGAEAAEFCMQELPGTQRVNLYYWYYATLGMYQLQGPYWDRWNQAMQNTLISRQRVDGDVAGSWDPECIWGGYGGRIYSTAMSALCLEVYYRYLPLYQSGPDPSERIGVRPRP